MNWQDTVMENYQVEALLGRKISPNKAFLISVKELDKLLKAQAKISSRLTKKWLPEDKR